MFLVALVLSALGVAVAPQLDAAALEREARHIETMLIAPCCWSQPVSQHQSQASEDVKRQIRVLLAAGRTRQEVLDAFAAQYGPRILAEPPMKGFGGLLYGGIGLSFLVTGAGLVAWIRRASRRSAAPERSDSAPRPEDRDYAARLDDELRDMD